MKHIFFFLFVLSLAGGTDARAQVENELEQITGSEWTVKADIAVYVSGADTAYAVSDSLYWLKSTDRDWIRCPTEPGPFPVDSLQGAARATLRGRAMPGLNGALARMVECITLVPSVLDSYR